MVNQLIFSNDICAVQIFSKLRALLPHGARRLEACSTDLVRIPWLAEATQIATKDVKRERSKEGRASG